MEDRPYPGTGPLDHRDRSGRPGDVRLVDAPSVVQEGDGTELPNPMIRKTETTPQATGVTSGTRFAVPDTVMPRGIAITKLDRHPGD